MKAPLTHVLIRSIGKGFYRVHAGMLLFFFIAAISYCFFINYAGTLPTESISLANLVLTLAFITSPFMMVAAFVVWAVYTGKAWQYTMAQLALPANQYLFYSATAFAKTRQWASWFLLQLFLLLPALCYSGFALALGILYGHLLLPLLALLYLLLLTGVSAAYYVLLANRLQGSGRTLRWLARLPKPYFSLFLYQLLHRHKLSIALVKGLSLAVMAYVALYGVDDFRALQIVVLLMVMGHCYLLLQEQRFEVLQLQFGLNFPYSRYRLLAFMCLRYTVLLLPEIAWLLRFRMSWGLPAAGFLLAMVMALRCWLYVIGPHAGRYLRGAFTFFILATLGIMGGLLWPIMSGCLVFSLVVCAIKKLRLLS
ncbi:hypothetical protein DCC81_20255 [Chitinophaga parva]|uniref:Uncharacterized protein n=1 Tax=Chitinophaga parva TaxID=2169414 RepID=A0A2T7BCG8_9BACT|nr:hypothetical protein [Chitinophaga parva]PUZ22762.1 hypothetical protein DCC81_20255 [Chitinophaga parva]